ncbi:MAG TPA: TMEM175 family protein [Gemmatimonadales bacterium]|nr:TMEM175 family protein [Gemmatimonadales bacterium]
MNQRLEAFCDGVFAIALTLLIIEFRTPEIGDTPTTPALWSALTHLGPTVFAFLLSFAVILITWINHHNTLRLVRRSSAAFMYANGLLLLGVVCIPFTTSLLGAFILTDAATPAVVLYDGLLAAQAVGWVAVTGAALRDDLAGEARAVGELRKRRNNGYGALALYSMLALLALWLPRAVAIATAITWIVWLALSLRAPDPKTVAA